MPTREDIEEFLKDPDALAGAAWSIGFDYDVGAAYEAVRKTLRFPAFGEWWRTGSRNIAVSRLTLEDLDNSLPGARENTLVAPIQMPNKGYAACMAINSLDDLLEDTDHSSPNPLAGC